MATTFPTDVLSGAYKHGWTEPFYHWYCPFTNTGNSKWMCQPVSTYIGGPI